MNKVGLEEYKLYQYFQSDIYLLNKYIKIPLNNSNLLD